MNRHLLPQSASVWIAALGVCLMISGCTKPLNLRGEGFNDNGFSNVNRPVNHTDALYGFSTKAQEIEKNLGVR